MSRREAFALFLVLCLSVPVVRAETPPAVDPDVKKGIQQVDEGDYDSAIFTLDSASRRLDAAKGNSNDIAQAYLYLGIAYLGKGREAAAKQQFREAIGQIKDLTLSADRFPPKVIDLFAVAKEEASHDAAAASTTTTAAEPEKKGGGHKGLLIGGIVLVGGGAAALAAGGGGGSSSPSGSSSGSSGSSGNSGLHTLGPVTGTLASQQYQAYQIVPTKSGTLTATLQWQNGQIQLTIGCQEDAPPYNGCGGAYNRTSNTTGQLTIPVTQQTYDLFVNNYNDASESYTLTVTFP